MNDAKLIFVSPYCQFCLCIESVANGGTFPSRGHLKINPKSLVLCFTPDETLLQCHCLLWVQLYLFLRYSGIGAIWGSWARIPQIMCQDTCKGIQSLQLLVSNQMRPYCSAILLSGLSYTCFTGTCRYWGSLGKLGLNTLNHAQGHKKSNPKISVPQLTSNEVLLLCQDQLRVQLYLSYGYSGIRLIWRNRAQIPPNHMK